VYAGEDFGVDLEKTLYALDCTTIDLCLALFPWARYRAYNAAVKLHTLLDLQGNIPAFIDVEPAKIHEIHTLDELLPEPGSIYIMDCAYLEFERLYHLHQALALFIIRSRKLIGISVFIFRPTGSIHSTTSECKIQSSFLVLGASTDHGRGQF